MEEDWGYAGEIEYVFRPWLSEKCSVTAGRCQTFGTGGALQMPGFGVEMAIKDMEYSALDDKKVDWDDYGGDEQQQAQTGEDVNPLSPGLFPGTSIGCTFLVHESAVTSAGGHWYGSIGIALRISKDLTGIVVVGLKACGRTGSRLQAIDGVIFRDTRVGC